METNENLKSLTETLSSLEEKKYNLINKAVTQGLRADVAYCDSGVQWIGRMPDHWQIQKGKYILTRLDRPVNEDDGVITCFRDGEVTLRTKRREEGFTISEKEIGYQGIEPGDLVVHGMDGFAGAIGISDSRGKGSPILNVMDTSMDKKFLMYYLRNMAYSEVFTGLATGIRVRSCDLRWEKLANLEFPVPPIEEQREIAEYLDKKCAEIDDVIGDIKAQIESLSKMRLSMISETITRGLNPNVEYKDSGIVWLGQIPAHWQVLKNKYIFDISKVIVENPENYQLLSLTTKGIRKKDENDTGGKVPENYNTYQVVVPNDIVMCLFDLDCSAVFSGLSPYRGMISPAYKILKTKNGVAIPEYMQYVFMHAFSGRHYKQYSKSLRFTVNADEFGTLFTIVPTIEEQREIAEYLDKKCAEIDDVIGDKEKQLGVLEEYKKSLIFEVVTGKREAF